MRLLKTVTNSVRSISSQPFDQQGEVFVPADVESAVRELGLHVAKVVGDEVYCHCPAHEERTGKPDYNPSFSINTETGLFHCFSCGFGGDFVSLVQYVCDWDRSTATGWVQRLPGGGVARRVVSRSRRVRQNESFLSEAKLALFTEPPEEALRQRDLRREEAMHYGIRWNPHGGWILPIHDLDTGNLVGWQEKTRTSVYNYPRGVRTSQAIFGSHLYDGGPLVIVESPLEGARIFGVGWPACALFGSAVSEAQINWLRIHCEIAILFMDNDPAGWKATRKLVSALRSSPVRLRIVSYAGLRRGVDPGDLSREELRNRIANAKSAIMFKC